MKGENDDKYEDSPALYGIAIDSALEKCRAVGRGAFHQTSVELQKSIKKRAEK